METTVVTKAEFDALPEYSLSLPTGTYVGKKWKRRQSGEWYLGEFVPDAELDRVGVRWTRLNVDPDSEGRIQTAG